jgi:predicted acyl esterase
MVPVDVAAGTVVAAGSGTADDRVIEWGARTTGPTEQIGEVARSLPAHSAADTLVSTSGPLRARTIVAGAPRADVVWTSTAADSQLDVKLYDVAPDGSAALLSRGCTTVHGVAGTAQHVSLALAHTAIEVAAGHRLQVWVQGSDAPTWLPAQQPSADSVGAGSRVLVPLLRP